MTVPDISQYDPNNADAALTGLTSGSNTESQVESTSNAEQLAAQQQQEQANNEVNKDNPSWEEILNVLPPEFHPLIKPKLQAWDKGVNEKFTEIRSEYDDFKFLKENEIPREAVEQALWFAKQFEENPDMIVQNAIEQLGLDFVAKSALEELAKAGVTPPNPSELEDDDDPLAGLQIENHPMFKALKEQVDTLTQKTQAEQEAEAEAKVLADHEANLKKLEEVHGEFDPIIVTAYMEVGGMTGDEAVKKYFDTINQAAAKIAGQPNQDNQQQQQETPPVVMSSNAGTGSGVPNNPVKMGALSNKAAEDLVVSILKANS